MKARKCFLLLLALCIVLCGIPTVNANAEDYSGTCGENLTWTLDAEAGVLTIEGEGDMYDYTSRDRAPWWNYNYWDIVQLNLPEGLTKIGNRAFSDCSSITNIEIPKSVTSIGSDAFPGLNDINSIVVAEGNEIYHSENNCLIETASKTLILGCKNSVIPTDGSVTSIGNGAFRGCNGLTSIEIPDSVTSIGNTAFASCPNLESIEIPNSVTSLGKRVFRSSSSLTSVILPANMTSVSAYMFQGCSSLDSIEIPENVTSIGEHAFYNSGISNITIPEGVSIIEENAFEECSNLANVYIYSQTIAEQLISSDACGGLLSSADKIYFVSTISDVPGYVNLYFSFVQEVDVDGTAFTVFSKEPIDAQEIKPGETVTVKNEYADHCFLFEPEEEGWYVFYESSGNEAAYENSWLGETQSTSQGVGRIHFYAGPGTPMYLTVGRYVGDYELPGEFTVTLVKAEAPESIESEKTEVTGYVGERFDLNLIFNPITSADFVTWDTDNWDLFQFMNGDHMGCWFELKAAGTATITATTESGKTAQIVVTALERPLLEEGKEETILIAPNDGEWTQNTYYYAFTPAESGTYKFYANAVPNSEDEVIYSATCYVNDETDWEDFYYFEAEAGVTYGLKVEIGSELYHEASVTVGVEKFVPTIAVGQNCVYSIPFSYDVDEELVLDFTPTESGVYRFYVVYDEEGYSRHKEWLYAADNSGEKEVLFHAEAGESYELRVRFTGDYREALTCTFVVVKCPAAESIEIMWGTEVGYVGEIGYASAYLSPEGCIPEAITWSVSDPSVLQILSFGYDTDPIGYYMLKAGTATITATTESGLTASMEVTVKEPLNLIEGDTVTLQGSELFLFAPSVSGWYAFRTEAFVQFSDYEKKETYNGEFIYYLEAGKLYSGYFQTYNIEEETAVTVVQIPVATPVAIKVSKTPDHTEFLLSWMDYMTDEDVPFAGLELEVTWSDGSKTTWRYNDGSQKIGFDYIVVGSDEFAGAAGTYNMFIGISEEVYDTWQVTFSDKTAVSMQLLDDTPLQVVEDSCEPYHIFTRQVLITFSDGSAVTAQCGDYVCGVMLWPELGTKDGENIVTYRLADIADLTVELPVEMIDSPVNRIELTANPTDTFVLGDEAFFSTHTDEFNDKVYTFEAMYNLRGFLGDFALTIHYNDGTVKTITSENIEWEMINGIEYPFVDGYPIGFSEDVLYTRLYGPTESECMIEYMGATVSFTIHIVESCGENHVYTAEITAPTCTENGYTTYTCSACGDSYVGDEVTAVGHTEEIIPGKEATCTENGLTEGKKCSVCGETLVEQEVIVAPGHSYGEPVIEDAPTCAEKGLMIATCICGAKLETEIAELGHTEEIIPGEEATCTENGLTEGKKCSVCGEILVEQEDVPAHGHNFDEDGNCTICGSPETGDAAVIMMVLIAMAMMAGAAVTIGKKKYF